MGHISNPVGLRLGYNRVWHVKGNRLAMFNILSRLAGRFFLSRRIQRLGILYSHSLVRYSLKHTFHLLIFLYDSRWNRLTTKSSEFLDKEKYNQIIRPYFEHLERAFLFEKIRLKFFQPIINRIKFVWSNQIRRINSLKITLIPIDNSCLSAVAIANFALRKLIANNQLSTIFQPIMLNVAVCHLGLRIIARGRFTRNQRATLNVFHFGKVPLNTFSIPIDYCFASIPLKFGVGSLKIWIGRTS